MNYLKHDSYFVTLTRTRMLKTISTRSSTHPKLLRRLALSSLLVATTVSIPFAQGLRAQSVPGRWLQVERFSGTVTTRTGNSKNAQKGDRLSAVGHSLVTGNRSSANLSVDSGIGSVAVAQNTRITIQQLSVLPDGARVTVLDIPQGQARAQVRPFSNPNSRLELHTPSGTAAVRGTIFGVSVAKDGRTGIATLEGQVEASAQSVSVPVDAGMVSIVRPGEPPTPARTLDRDLDIQWHTHEWQSDHLYISGRIDAANTLFVDEQEITTSRAGYFEDKIPLARRRHRVLATVQNPVGETRDHSLFRWLAHSFDR